jgi:hypothetical protein
MAALERDAVRAWLARRDPPPRLRYPDVAAALVDWLLAGEHSRQALAALSARLWREVTVSGGARAAKAAGAEETLALSA